MAQEVTINQLAQAIPAGAYVIDVREAWEFESGHVPGARHVPLNSVPEQLNNLPKDQQIWIICQSGGRSMTAANYLEAQGFDVVSVAGGTGSWIGSGKEVSFEVSL
jgi:rhodanese-related sulfurtransferase